MGRMFKGGGSPGGLSDPTLRPGAAGAYQRILEYRRLKGASQPTAAGLAATNPAADRSAIPAATPRGRPAVEPSTFPARPSRPGAPPAERVISSADADEAEVRLSRETASPARGRPKRKDYRVGQKNTEKERRNRGKQKRKAEGAERSRAMLRELLRKKPVTQQAYENATGGKTKPTTAEKYMTEKKRREKARKGRPPMRFQTDRYRAR